MNAMQIVETAQQHWDKDSAAEHGFDSMPGDAILQYGAEEDTNQQYRIVQFIDIVHPTDTPRAARGLIVEYVATEANMPATYHITTEVDSAAATPDDVNRILSTSNTDAIYDLTRTSAETFEISGL